MTPPDASAPSNPHGNIHVVKPDDGEGYWRPQPANGYVVVKINLAMGIQVIPPGGFVPEHSHEKQEEILFCYEGEGIVEVDGAPHGFVPGTVIYATPLMKHKIINTGEIDLKFTWTMTPPGLENFFAAIGKTRQPGDPAPTPFDPPASVQRIQAETGFGHKER
jgi:quercetin dioxygenase-like cupin family protein